MTARQDFTLDSGRDYGLAVTLFEADMTTPLNLFDCELTWVMTPVAGTKELISKSSVNPAEIELVSEVGGALTIHIHAADTDDFGMLTCEHELLVTDAAGLEATVMAGLVTITRSLIH